MDSHNTTRRRVFMALILLAAFVVGNVLFYLIRTPPCCDWQYTTGIPFAFLEEGGFAGIRRILWAGVASDIAVIFALVLIADRIATQPRTRRSVTAAKRRVLAAVAGESWLPLTQLAVALAIIMAACIIAFLTKHWVSIGLTAVDKWRYRPQPCQGGIDEVLSGIAVQARASLVEGE